MKFKTTLSQQNRNEFIKSWASVYQTGLMTFRQKREATDVGVIRPATAYLVALVLGYAITAWGMQLLTASFAGLEVFFAVLVLFFIAFNIAYGIRPKWFSFIARRKIYPKNPVIVETSDEGITFHEEGQEEKTHWKWSELTKAIPFSRTLVLYNKDCKSFGDAKGHVLLINKDDLAEEDWNTLYEGQIKPLNIHNQFRTYYSYSDIVIFLIFCLLIAFVSLPFALAGI